MQKTGAHYANDCPFSHSPRIASCTQNPAAATKIHKVFDIVRGNDKIGTDTIDIERQNDTTTIKCVLVFCLYRPTRLNPDSVRAAMMFE
jgi:hypothetical protein